MSFSHGIRKPLLFIMTSSDRNIILVQFLFLASEEKIYTPIATMDSASSFGEIFCVIRYDRADIGDFIRKYNFVTQKTTERVRNQFLALLVLQ